MDVQDGFILGVYNYCDRWCEQCRFTSRCRVFADMAIHDASGDTNLKAVAEAPAHPSDLRELPRWIQESFADFDESKLPELPAPPPLPPRLATAISRASRYSDDFFHWYKSAGIENVAEMPAPFDVIMHFSWMIASKTRRAIKGLNEDDGCRDYPPDFEGSAKVALDGIERSIAAWRELSDRSVVPADVAARFIVDLGWLVREIDVLVPKARTFLRPGLDEPDEVAKLEISDWS